MDNLNKENFFNDLQSRYPAAFTDFTAWIDNYKERVNWKELFNGGIGFHRQKKNSDGSISGEVGTTEAPKFHDLPFALQMGVLLTYTAEKTGMDDAIDMKGFAENFQSLFSELNNIL